MNLWKLTTFILAALLAVVVGKSTLDPAHAQQARPQPHMQSALDHLKQARAELEAATPDKGGHRVRAIALAKKAIVEVEKGIAWDNAHKSRAEEKK